MYDCRECDEIGWRFMLYFNPKLEENNRNLSGTGINSTVRIN
jgi:hypothetical protein